MIRISVMYPNDGGTFDMEYYKHKHLDLVHTLLDPYGLVNAEIDKGIATNQPGAKPPYITIGHLYFNTMEEMEAALKAHDPDLAADVQNFTNIQPIFQISEIL